MPSRLTTNEVATLAIFFLALYVAITAYLPTSCVCLDDAYIYLTTARNFQDGFGPVINAGEGHSGATSGLWAAALGTVLDFSSPIEDTEYRVRLLTTVLLSLASFGLYVSFRSVIGPFAALSPLAVVSIPYITVFAGMETAAAILMLVLLTLAVQRGRYPFFCGVLVGVGYLARAELIAFLPLALIAFAFPGRGYSLMAAFQRKGLLLRLLAGAALMPALWHLYMYATIGEIFPATFSAKLAQGASGQIPLYSEGLVSAFWIAISERWYLGIFAAIGAIVARSVLWPLLAFWLIHVSLYSLLNAPQYFWYNYDTFFVLHLLTFVGVAFVLNSILLNVSKIASAPANEAWVPSAIRSRNFNILFGLLAGVMTIAVIQASGPIVTEPGRKIQIEPYKRVADFITSMGAYKGQTLLTQEVGALSYFLPGIVIRDTNGIATPDMTARNMNSWQVTYERFKPDIIVPMFDRWGEKVAFADRNHRVEFFKREFVASPQDSDDRAAPVYFKIADRPPYLDVPAHLRFSSDSQDRMWLSFDWGPSELGAWSQGPTGKISLPLAEPLSNYTISLALYPFIRDGIRQQTVVILQDGMQVYKGIMTEARPYVHTFKGVDNVSQINLELEFPNQVIPAVAGLGKIREPHSAMLLELDISFQSVATD